MSRQIRVTLNETELALLEAVQEQENLSSIHAALTRVLGRFAREHHTNGRKHRSGANLS